MAPIQELTSSFYYEDFDAVVGWMRGATRSSAQGRSSGSSCADRRAAAQAAVCSRWSIHRCLY